MTMRRAAAALAVSALVASGCGGDDDAERAQTQVCDARADLTRHTEALADLTVAEVTGGQVGESIEAIRADLAAIADAQRELSDERREQVQQASDTFAAELRDAATQVATGAVGGGRAAEAARTALAALATTVREAYDRIDCPEG
jgi:hypothetical protein